MYVLVYAWVCVCESMSRYNYVREYEREILLVDSLQVATTARPYSKLVHVEPQPWGLTPGPTGYDIRTACMPRTASG